MESQVKNPFLNIKTLGVSTGRYVSFLPLPKDEALASFGSSISLWNMENLTKRGSFSQNENLITCLLKNKSTARHASRGEKYLVINSEKGKEQEGTEILKIDEERKKESAA